jgi:hypothetical protein
MTEELLLANGKTFHGLDLSIDLTLVISKIEFQYHE